jgi:hypothetical protein
MLAVQQPSWSVQWDWPTAVCLWTSAACLLHGDLALTGPTELHVQVLLLLLPEAIWPHCTNVSGNSCSRAAGALATVPAHLRRTWLHILVTAGSMFPVVWLATGRTCLT